MTNIATKQSISTDVSAPFRWKDQDGNLWHPRDMETRHLFYAVRMIWNHAMPEEAQTHDFNTYRFSDFYTVEYMKLAVRTMIAELETRDDMRDQWREQYEFMKRRTRRLRLAE